MRQSEKEKKKVFKSVESFATLSDGTTTRTNQDNKGWPCPRGPLYAAPHTTRGIVQRPGICDIKLFNHRTIEKARVSHVVGDSRRCMCACVCAHIYIYIYMHSCMCIGSRIARKSRPFRVFPLPPLRPSPSYSRILWRNDEHAYTPIQHACRGRWVSVRNIQLNRRGIECVGWGGEIGGTSFTEARARSLPPLLLFFFFLKDYINKNPPTICLASLKIKLAGLWIVSSMRHVITFINFRPVPFQKMI